MKSLFCENTLKTHSHHKAILQTNLTSGQNELLETRTKFNAGQMNPAPEPGSSHPGHIPYIPQV